MTDTTVLEVNTLHVPPDLQGSFHGDLDSLQDKMPGTAPIPDNTAEPVHVPTWSEQVTTFRDDFIQGKNPTAFFSLVNQEMRRYFTSQYQSPPDTEDLTQEVLIKLLLWQKKFSETPTSPGPEAPSNFPAFIRRIAHNVLTDKYRRQKATFVDFTSSDNPDDDESFLERLPDAANPIDEQVVAHLEASQLKIILPALTDRQQQLLTLLLKGQSNKEIAESLSMKPGTVDKALWDLRNRMRTLLTPPESQKK